MKNTRNDKRRRQLTKQNVRKGNTVALKLNNSTRRILSLVVALAVLLSTVIVGLNIIGKTEDISKSLQPVEMSVRVNGANNWTTATVPAGTIQTAVDEGTVKFKIDPTQTGVGYEKTVLVDTNNNTETEVKSAGKIVEKSGNNETETVYYSMEADTDLGTKLESGQSLVMVYSSAHNVTVNMNIETEHGSVITSANDEHKIIGGADLRLILKPDADYQSPEKISYRVGEDGATEQATVVNNAAKIPGSAITDDLYINVVFEQINSYKLRDSRYISTKTYPNWYHIENHGGLSSAPIETVNKGTSIMEMDSAVGGNLTFYVYSQNCKLLNHYDLNMLAINGTDIKFPASVGGVETTPFGNGTITVTYLSDDTHFADERNGGQVFGDHRSQYKVEITNVHSDLDLAYNFRDRDTRTIIVKGLRGIEKTGASDEHQGIGFDRYYTVNMNEINVYNTEYSWTSNLYPSNNLITYTVKPGYNPYTVETEMAIGNAAPSPDNVRYSTVGDPVEVIYNAGNGQNGNFNTDWRYWGANDKLQNRDATYKILGKKNTLLLTTLANDKNYDWYAIALQQNSNRDQRLWLNAQPYTYQIQLESGDNDATVSAQGYTENSLVSTGTEGHVYLETAKHTVEDQFPYFVLPAETPVWDNEHVFQGWQLVNADGEVLSDELYFNNSQIELDEATIRKAVAKSSDNTNMEYALRFRAKWVEVKEADTTTVSLKTLQQVLDYNGAVADLKDAEEGQYVVLNDKTYKVIYTNTETQIAGKETAVLNDHDPGSPFELNSDSSVLEQVTSKRDPATHIPDSNRFYTVYDLKTRDLSVEKEVNGRPNTSAFNISITLHPVAVEGFSENTLKENIVVEDTINDSTSTISEPFGDGWTFTKKYVDGETITLHNVPAGWTYTVEEAQKPDDYETSFTVNGEQIDSDNGIVNGTVNDTTRVVVTNQKKNDDPNIVSDKWLTRNPEGTSYDITMDTYAVGATVADEESVKTPVDIALVIDQSGSMGTEDMNPTYTEKTDKTTWTVHEATGGKTYFYKVGDKYYPVQAQEGPLYEPVENEPYARQAMGGRGHDQIAVVPYSYFHLNVPTQYYALDANGVAHKVYMMTAGATLQYRAWPYYYTDNNYTGNNYKVYADGQGTSSYTTSLINETHPYNNGEEYTVRVGVIDLTSGTDTNDIYKTHNEDLYRALGGTITGTIIKQHHNSEYAYWPTINFEGIAHFASMAYNGQVCFVDQPDATMTSARNAQLTYSWITSGGRISGLYLPKDGTTYNGLYYVDDNGNKVQIGNTTYTEGQTAYNGTLYEVSGDSRVSVLKEAVSNFVDQVEQNAQENDLDHRIAMIGFAGNKFPGNSVGETAYDTTKYDYTNTGLFLNNTFKNYEMITGYQAYNGTKYINRHYFIKDGSNYVPVIYSSGKWYRLDTYAQVSTSTQFYEPIYQDLTAQDYQDALVDVSENGAVNPKLTDAIDNFANYGGTYTSYGIHMANQLFENNDKTYIAEDGSEQQRKRIIVVFTDGEPGANGYSSSIAGEALVDGNIAKFATEDGGQDATVYTLGLFPGNASTEVTKFMEELSSEYTVPIEPVYADANVLDGGPRNANNNYGAGELNPDDTYYYTAEDGKTYAVTTTRNGQSTLGWWAYTGDAFMRLYPKTGSDDDDTNAVTFRDANGNAVYDDDNGLDKTAEYYYNNYPVHYEYRWYDSNSSVIEPKTGENSQGTQFLKLGTPAADESGMKYYYKASDQDELRSCFDQIGYYATHELTNVSLTDKNSWIQDTVSDFFDLPEDLEYEVQRVPGHWDAATKKVVFDESAAERAHGIDVERINDKQVKITGDDFSENYINGTEGHETGYKLRVILKNVAPNSTGGEFDSNTANSGVYYDKKSDLYPDGKLIDAFPIPSISRYKYTIDVKGDDVTTPFTTNFDVTGSGATVASLSHYNENSDALKNGTGVTSESNNSIIFEQINDVEQFAEPLMDDNTFKHSDGIADDFTVSATVSGASSMGQPYHYTDKIDNGAVNDWESPYEDIQVGDLKKDDTTVYINSTQAKQAVNIHKIAQAKDGDADYADRAQKFQVELTLTKADNTPAAGYVYKDVTGYTDEDGEPIADLTFDENGKATLWLAHNESVTFEIPEGYSLVVEEKDYAPYEVSYRRTYTEETQQTDPETGDTSTVAKTKTVVTDDKSTISRIDRFQAVRVINSLAAPVVTGFLDNEKHFGAILAAVGGVSLAAAAGYVFYRKRRGLTR